MLLPVLVVFCLISRSFYFQLRIIAYDSSNPNQKATALVSISVTRNENGPVFAKRTYRVDATESMELGARIVQVNATDKDGVRSF